MSDIPDGFFHQRPAITTSEAVGHKPNTREINVTKSVIQKYIEGWLRPESKNRDILQRYAPRAMQFVGDRTGSRNIHFETGVSWESDDPSKRAVQLSRFFERVRESSPMILIIDGGFRNRPAGLGDIHGSRIVGGNGAVQDIDLVMALVINIDIMVAALDESTCSDLAAFLSSILGSPLRRFGGGNHLVSSDPTNHYQVTLPLENTFSALSRENVTEDVIDSKWTTTTSLEVEFDATTSIRTSLPIRAGNTSLGDAGGSQGTQVGVDSNVADSYPPVIGGPSTVRLGHPSTYSLTGGGYPIRWSTDWYWVVSDFRIAAFDPNNGILRPRQCGNIEIRVIDKNRTETDDDGHTHPMVIARMAVSVTP